MKYKRLGNSGLKVSELCFGTMNFGQVSGGGSTDQEARECFETYVDAGGNFFDTANMYHAGHAEELLSDFVGAERDKYVISSKITFPSHPFHPKYLNDPNGAGNSRKNLRRELEDDLRRLKTDYIDVLYLHCWDYSVPVVELMSTLNDFIREGKINYIGATNVPAYIVAEANTLAKQYGWAEFICCEGQYSLASRTIEREILPMCKHFGLGLTAYEPLAAGLLCGDEDEMNARLDGVYYARPSENQLKLLREVSAIARECGATVPQVAIRWLQSRGNNVIPIVGGRIKEHIESNLKACDVILTEDQIAKLDDISKIEMGYPNDMIRSLNTWVYNHQYDNIEMDDVLPDFFKMETTIKNVTN